MIIVIIVTSPTPVHKSIIYIRSIQNSNITTTTTSTTTNSIPPTPILPTSTTPILGRMRGNSLSDVENFVEIIHISR